MKKYKSLETWIREALSDSDKDKPCSVIACVYFKPNGGEKEIHTVKLSGKTWKPEDLAELFRGKAETYAQDLGGIQSFELKAFYGSNEAEATHPFKVLEGEIQSGGTSRAIRETADAAGIVAQSMRHTERSVEHTLAVVQQLSVNCQRILEMSVEREDRHYKREAELQEEVTDAYKIIREMTMSQMRLDHESRMKEITATRDAQERKQLITMIPALVNTASGKEVFPQSTADSVLLDKLAENVKPEMIEQLMASGLIPKELAGPLTMRLKEALERRENERKLVRIVPPANADPIKDAQGS